MAAEFPEFKGLILSGGRGTRLRPITYSSAKQVLPVANKPILHYAVESLTAAGITNIGVVISPETGEDVKKCLSSITNCSFTYILQEAPLGLAHAVTTSREFLQDSNFVMYLGDNLIRDGVLPLLQKFKKSNSDSLLLLKEVENPQSFGVAVLDENGSISSLEEKPEHPQSSLALVGVYLFNKEIHKAISQIKPSKRGELEITDAISKLLDLGYKVDSHILPGWWLDTGKKDDLLEANRIILDELSPGDPPQFPSSKIVGRVIIGSNCNIINCNIRGPAIIGDNCSLVNTFIGPYTSVGSGACISNTEISHSILWENCKIEDLHGRIEDSIIGSGVSISKVNTRPSAYKLLLGDDSQIEVI